MRKAEKCRTGSGIRIEVLKLDQNIGSVYFAVSGKVLYG